MKTIERYLARQIISHSLLVLLALLLVLILGELMIQLGSLSDSYTLPKGVAYSLLKIPAFGYEILPLSLLIGSLLALGSMANSSELTVLRASGWSIGRIFWAVIKSVMIFWLVMALLGELFSSPSESLARKIKAEASNQTLTLGGRGGFWLKEDRDIIHVGRAVALDELRNITIYQINDGKLSQVLTAQKAVYKQDSWTLYKLASQSLSLVEQELFEQKLLRLDWSKTSLKKLDYNLPIEPDLIQQLQLEPRYLRVTELYNYMDFLQRNDLDVGPYALDFWRKIMAPLTVIGLIALVFPLVFGSQRQVSIGQRIFLGVVIGMVFYLANQLFGNLSLVYKLPPILGAVLPSLSLFLVAIILLRRVK